MKLYTEEQIKDAFIKGVLKGMAGSTLSTYELFEMYISELTPIELPSDEDISTQASNRHYGTNFKHVYASGAKWMKEQIIGLETNNIEAV
jgi:hypothetical protein